ncbi:MAG: hypothetical protein RL213_1842 [Bacteroidota bacterium]|jgi:2-C-methyl-D-erythritol 2,4-cyclodiphosphate synthase
MRIGIGFDVHQLKENHPFWLGGIRVAHEKGAFGHSDADVIIHAICDALLGAVNLGDIGKHFPDTSADFKNIDSKILLHRVCSLIGSEGYEIGNIDVTLCLQRPKIGALIPEMIKVLCGVMELPPGDLSIKATTNEKLGFIGREEGVTAYAVALVFRKGQKEKA